MSERDSNVHQADEARAFAEQAHRDQRYGDEPYVVHLDAVADLLTPYGDEARTIGYLHDVLEDTETTFEEIRDRFGDHVAQCVMLVTDEAGINRKARKARTNAKLASIDEEYQTALIVKAADRLANLRQSARETTGSKLSMYRHEHDAFRNAVFRPGLCDEFWNEMEQLLNTQKD